MTENESSIPLQNLRTRRIQLFSDNFFCSLENKVQENIRAVGGSLHWTFHFAHNPDRSDETGTLLVAVLVDPDFDSRTNLRTFEDIVADRDGKIRSCAAVHFSYDGEPEINVLQMFTRADCSGRRLSVQLLALCLMRLLREKSFVEGAPVDWRQVMVRLDDCTDVPPPRNIFYRLGFRVYSDLMSQFVRWNQWIEQSFDPENRPYPDERRALFLQELLWSLSNFL